MNTLPIPTAVYEYKTSLDVFELRVFLNALSSTDPYVQGDALSRLSLTMQDSIDFIVREPHVLAKEAGK